MADITTITKQGAFTSDIAAQINDNFTALNSGGGGVTWPLSVNSVPNLTGVLDTANSSEQAAVVYPSSGSDPELIVAYAYTDGDTWSGLRMTSTRIETMIDGSQSNTGLTILTGSAGMNIGASGPGVTFTSRAVLGNGNALSTTITAAHTATIQAYDVDGAAYKTFATLTNGNTPDFTIAAPSGGTVVLQPTTYKSSDGTAGAAGGTFTAITSITVKDGIITAITGT